jgi:hypothetical protein
MISPHDTINIGLNINRAAEIFDISSNDFRFISALKNTITFPYRTDRESILDGWIGWGNITYRYRDENYNIDEATMKWLEDVFSDILSYLTVNLEELDEIDYPVAYVPELNALIMNTHLEAVSSDD